MGHNPELATRLSRFLAESFPGARSVKIEGIVIISLDGQESSTLLKLNRTTRHAEDTQPTENAIQIENINGTDQNDVEVTGIDDAQPVASAEDFPSIMSTSSACNGIVQKQDLPDASHLAIDPHSCYCIDQLKDDLGWPEAQLEIQAPGAAIVADNVETVDNNCLDNQDESSEVSFKDDRNQSDAKRMELASDDEPDSANVLEGDFGASRDTFFSSLGLCNPIDTLRNEGVSLDDDALVSNFSRSIQPPSLTCTPCRKTFKHRFLLHEHQQSHPVECVTCSHLSPSEFSFRRHARIYHLNGKNYLCPYCKSVFLTFKQTTRHIVVEHKIPDLSETPLLRLALQGGKIAPFAALRNKVGHSLWMRQGKHGKWTCRVCRKNFSRYGMYLLHQKSHKVGLRHGGFSQNAEMTCLCGNVEDEPLRCDECGEEFLILSDLLRHHQVCLIDSNSAANSNDVQELQDVAEEVVQLQNEVSERLRDDNASELANNSSNFAGALVGQTLQAGSANAQNSVRDIRDSLLRQSTSQGRSSYVMVSPMRGQPIPKSCPGCGFTSVHPQSVQKHILNCTTRVKVRQHNGKLFCPFCNFSSTMWKAMTGHIKHKHRNSASKRPGHSLSGHAAKSGRFDSTHSSPASPRAQSASTSDVHQSPIKALSRMDTVTSSVSDATSFSLLQHRPERQRASNESVGALSHEDNVEQIAQKEADPDWRPSPEDYIIQTCSGCGYPTQNSKAMDTHIETCTITTKIMRRNGLLSCPFCPFTCKNWAGTLTHIKRKHPDRCIQEDGYRNDVMRKNLSSEEQEGTTFQCALCAARPTTLGSYRTHLYTHHRIGGFMKPANSSQINADNLQASVCPHCSFTSMSSRGIQLHINRKHPEMVACATNDVQEDSATNLPQSNTSRPMLQEQDLNCPNCSFKASVPFGLKVHISHCHKDVSGVAQSLAKSANHYSAPANQYDCPACTFSANSGRDLESHIIQSHASLPNLPASSTQTVIQSAPTSPSYVPFVQGTQHLSPQKAGHDDSLSCPHCDYRASKPIGLKVHIGHLHKERKEASAAVKQSTGPFKCYLCNFGSRSEYGLKTHFGRMHKKLPKCPHCTFVAPDSNSLQEHLETEHHIYSAIQPSPGAGKDVFKCSQCPFACSNERGLRAHKGHMHSGRKNLAASPARDSNLNTKCSHCGFIAHTVDLLATHTAQMHSERLSMSPHNLQCPSCNYHGNHVHGLKIHIARVHTIPNRTSDQMVGNKDISEDNTYFMSSPDLPEQDVNGVFKCPKCPFSTRHSGWIKRHMGLHNRSLQHEPRTPTDFQSVPANTPVMQQPAQYRLQCPLCDFTSRDSGWIKRHMRVHNSNAQPEEAANVLKVKDTPSTSTHLSPEAPLPRPVDGVFSCSLCNFSTRYFSWVRRHMNAHDRSMGQGLSSSTSIQNASASAPLSPKTPPMMPQSVDGIFKCSVCNFATQDSGWAKRHMNKHNKNLQQQPSATLQVRGIPTTSTSTAEDAGNSFDDGLNCPHCSYLGNSRMGLKVHIARVHTMSPHKKTSALDQGASTTTQGVLLTTQNAPVVQQPVDGIFNCTFCTFSTQNHGWIKRHMNQYHKDDLPTNTQTRAAEDTGNNFDDCLNCPHCSYHGNSRMGLRVHMARVHASPRRNASAPDQEAISTSQKASPTAQDVSYQMASSLEVASPSCSTSVGITSYQTSGGKFWCSECSFATTNYSWICRHFKEKHTEKLPESPVKDTPSKEVVNPVLKCPHCDFVARVPRGLKWHVSHEHEELMSDTETVTEPELASTGAMNCNHCGFQTTFALGLKQHIGKMHKGTTAEAASSDEPSLRCQKCEFTASSEGELETHAHTCQAKPMHDAIDANARDELQCSFCSYKARVLTGIRVHVYKAHRKEWEAAKNSVTCAQCGLRCAGSDALQAHVDLEHGDSGSSVPPEFNEIDIEQNEQEQVNEIPSGVSQDIQEISSNFDSGDENSPGDIALSLGHSETDSDV